MMKQRLFSLVAIMIVMFSWVDTAAAMSPHDTNGLSARLKPSSFSRPFGGNGFSVSLSSSSSLLWIGQSATVTATTNADVGPTPYYISVYDQTAHMILAVCGWGTTCSAAVSQQAVTTHSYQAYVGDYPASNTPPGFILASSNTVTITWLIFIWRW